MSATARPRCSPSSTSWTARCSAAAWLGTVTRRSSGSSTRRGRGARRLVHRILDNYATHKHPKVRAWLARHERWTVHYTPTSASWLNAVEGFFATLTRRRLKRGVFHSLVELQAAINRYLDAHNQ